MSKASHAHLPQFGKHIAGVLYIRRPGAYAVIRDAGKRIAVMQIRNGYFLPGGGRKEGETPEQTLRREIREECGCAVSIQRKIGETIDRFFAKDIDRHFEIHSHFFVATFQAPFEASIEPEHQLIWLTLDEAVHRLNRPSQVWAVQQVTE